MNIADELSTLQTDGIAVSAGPVLMENSVADRNLWGYYLCIENNTSQKIRLVGKDWNITDDKGNRYNDSSVGFKGELPELEPGEYFEYTSYAPLQSSNAVFYGSCQIQTNGRNKKVRIPTFSMTSKHHLSTRVFN